MIATEQRGRVAVITIDRHQRRNALDLEHLGQLRAAVTAALGGEARAIVVTGVGTVFSAGADLSSVYGADFREELYSTLHAFTASPAPVLAAVNGPAIGAGTQLALACDLRVASPTASFAIPTARNGLAVDPWTVRRLAHLAGGGLARRLLLGAGECPAQHALACGLADRGGDLETTLAWAEEIASLAPLSLAYSKKALEVLFDEHTWPPGLDEAFEACWSSADLAEGIRARAEKRPAEFEGR